MSLLLQNHILQAAEDKIEKGLTQKNRDDYMKIVVAGMKLALDKGPNGLLAALHSSKDPVTDAAKGAVNLCLLMRKQSRGTMPMKAMVPAGMTLMLKALDFVDKTAVKKIGNAELVQASKIFTNFLLQQLHITPDMLKGAASSIQGIMQNPQQMQALQQKAGMGGGTAPQEQQPAPEVDNGV